VDLDAASAVVHGPGLAFDQLSLLDDGVRQQLVGGAAEGGASGIGGDEEDPAGRDRPEVQPELLDLMTQGSPDRIAGGTRPDRLGHTDIDAIDHGAGL